MKHLKLLLCLPVLLAVSACDEAPVDENRLAAAASNGDRAAGSCSPEACGEYIPSNSCQCDAACVDYGDCCHDVDAVCNDVPVDECGSNDDCPEFCGWNDDNLRVCKPWAQVGESCEGFVLPAFRASCAPGLECEFSEPTFDIPGVCVDPDEEPVFCGGIAAIQCPAGQHCQLEGSFPDAGGSCQPGSAQGGICGGIAGFSCLAGLECVIDNPFPDADGVCMEPCVPAGCSGQVCALESEAPGVITTCEVLPEYICFGETTCGHHGADGACGWEQNDAYLECLADFEEPVEPAPDSCEGHCGDQAEAGCYCDSVCAYWGDCCDDKVAICG
ncbi:MAG: hypothetical protein ACRBN8_15220 [Nannocystales bacterium]